VAWVGYQVIRHTQERPGDETWSIAKVSAPLANSFYRSLCIYYTYTEGASKGMAVLLTVAR